jgi:8-oxo-dGTP diphosphatase
MDAGDRAAWVDDQDLRPLSDLGRKQANALAGELARWQGLRYLFASPALRARETLEPVAKLLGLEVETLTSLAERRPGESDAAMAQRGESALDEIRRRVGTGVAVAASHGDIIPAAVDRIARRRRLRVGRIERRGQWFAVTYASDLSVTIELCEAPGFPG